MLTLEEGWSTRHKVKPSANKGLMGGMCGMKAAASAACPEWLKHRPKSMIISGTESDGRRPVTLLCAVSRESRTLPCYDAGSDQRVLKLSRFIQITLANGTEHQAFVQGEAVHTRELYDIRHVLFH